MPILRTRSTPNTPSSTRSTTTSEPRLTVEELKRRATAKSTRVDRQLKKKIEAAQRRQTESTFIERISRNVPTAAGNMPPPLPSETCVPRLNMEASNTHATAPLECTDSGGTPLTSTVDMRPAEAVAQTSSGIVQKRANGASNTWLGDEMFVLGSQVAPSPLTIPLLTPLVRPVSAKRSLRPVSGHRSSALSPRSVVPNDGAPYENNEIAVNGLASVISWTDSFRNTHPAHPERARTTAVQVAPRPSSEGPETSIPKPTQHYLDFRSTSTSVSGAPLSPAAGNVPTPHSDAVPRIRPTVLRHFSTPDPTTTSTRDPGFPSTTPTPLINQPASAGNGSTSVAPRSPPQPSQTTKLRPPPRIKSELAYLAVVGHQLTDPATPDDKKLGLLEDAILDLETMQLNESDNRWAFMRELQLRKIKAKREEVALLIQNKAASAIAEENRLAQEKTESDNKERKRQEALDARPVQERLWEALTNTDFDMIKPDYVNGVWVGPNPAWVPGKEPNPGRVVAGFVCTGLVPPSPPAMMGPVAGNSVQQEVDPHALGVVSGRKAKRKKTETVSGQDRRRAKKVRFDA